MQHAKFRASRAKVLRARRHIDELETALAAYLDRRPVLAIGFERSIGSQYQFNMTLLTIERIPLDLLMIFGDAVHNIRTVLDFVVNETVSSRRTPPADLAFPFSRSSESLGRQIREKMKGTSPEERDLVRSLRPFPGGDEHLYAIHELDKMDKHRVPIEISTQVISHTMKVHGAPTRPRLVHQGRISPVPTELEEKIPPMQGFTRLGVLEDATREAVIAKGLPLEGMSVIHVLTSLADKAEEIIDRFASLP